MIWKIIAHHYICMFYSTGEDLATALNVTLSSCGAINQNKTESVICRLLKITKAGVIINTCTADEWHCVHLRMSASQFTVHDKV